MAKVRIVLTRSGKHPDGTPRLRIPARAVKTLLDKYPAFKLRYRKTIIPVKVRSDKRLELPKKFVKKLKLKKGRRTFHIESARKLAPEERFITKRRVLRITRRKQITKSLLIDAPLSIIPEVGEWSKLLEPKLVREIWEMIEKFIRKSYNKLDKGKIAHELYATLISKIDGSRFPTSTKITTHDYNPETGKVGKDEGLKYVLNRLEKYLMMMYGYAMFYRNKEIVIWKVEYASRRMLHGKGT